MSGKPLDNKKNSLKITKKQGLYTLELCKKCKNTCKIKAISNSVLCFCPNFVKKGVKK